MPSTRDRYLISVPRLLLLILGIGSFWWLWVGYTGNDRPILLEKPPVRCKTLQSQAKRVAIIGKYQRPFSKLDFPSPPPDTVLNFHQVRDLPVLPAHIISTNTAPRVTLSTSPYTNDHITSVAVPPPLTLTMILPNLSSWALPSLSKLIATW